MIVYLFRKIITLVVVLLLIAHLGFGLSYLQANSPFAHLSFWQAYYSFFSYLFTAHLPTAIHFDLSFYQQLRQALPATLELCILAILLSLLIAVPLGIYSGLNPNRHQTQIIQTICLVLGASPLTWLSVLIIFMVSSTPQLLPSFGSQIEQLYPVTGFVLIDIFLASNINVAHELAVELQYLALPTLILAIQPTIVGIQLISQNITVISQQNYVKAALVREPLLRRVLLSHILPNALPSTIPSLAYNFNLLLFCAMVVEIIFQRNGLGSWIMQAYTQSDIVALTLLMIICSVLISLLNIVSDFLMMLLLPLKQKALYGQR